MKQFGALSYLGRFSNTSLATGRAENAFGQPVSDHFARLCFREPIIHCSVEVIRHLGDLTGRNERAHGHETSVTRGKTGPQPQVAKQNVCGVLHQPWRNTTELPSERVLSRARERTTGGLDSRSVKKSRCNPRRAQCGHHAGNECRAETGEIGEQA